MSIRILLADDQTMVRSALRALLENEPGMEVVAEAPDGRTAVQLIRQIGPDVVIMDVRMPDLNGIDATRQAIAEHNDVKVIGLSAHADHRLTAELLKAGAAGFVVKDAAFEELVRAIHTVMADKVHLSPSVAGVIVDDYLRNEPAERSSAFATLTAREREVLQLLAEGKAMKQIAMHLRLSVKTVETHRRQIMDKLNIHSVAELTKYALREGLTSLEP